MVLLEVGSMTKAGRAALPAYTTAKANVSALSSGCPRNSCAMADDVLVEADTNAGMLQPVPARSGAVRPARRGEPDRLHPNGISDTLEPAEPFVANPARSTPTAPQQAQRRHRLRGRHRRRLWARGRERVEGVPAVRPGPKTTPVMGSYNENTVAAKATSAWYELPPRSPDRPLVTVAAAGAIWFYDEEGQFNYGQSLKLQWGVHRPDGSFQALGSVQPIDVIAQKAWRNLRFPMAWRRRRPTWPASSPTTRT